MKNIGKYGTAFLLIFIFSCKIITLVFSNFRDIAKTSTEQLEDKNAQEKDGEKFADYEVEAAFIYNFEHYTISLFQGKCLTAGFQQLFLPVQYFAIPTPPPWCKS